MSLEQLRASCDALEARADSAPPHADWASLRREALALAAEANDHRWTAGTCALWALAAQCEYQRARFDADQCERLLSAARDLADVLELLAARTSPLAGRGALRAGAMLPPLVASIRRTSWPQDQVLQVATAVRRAVRAAERVLPRSIGSQVFTDPVRARKLEDALAELFAEYLG